MTDRYTAIENAVQALLVAQKATLKYKSIKNANRNMAKKYPNIAIYCKNSRKSTEILGNSAGGTDEWKTNLMIDVKIHDYSREEKLVKTNQMIAGIEDILDKKENRRLGGLVDLMTHTGTDPAKLFTDGKVIKMVQFTVEILNRH